MKRMLVVLFSACMSFSGCAQESSKGPDSPPSPEQMQTLMESTIGVMGPITAKMMDSMIEVMLQRGEDPATAKRIARFKKNLYDALIKEGFSPEQSFQIMQNTGLPSAAPQMK